MQLEIQWTRSKLGKLAGSAILEHAMAFSAPMAKYIYTYKYVYSERPSDRDEKLVLGEGGLYLLLRPQVSRVQGVAIHIPYPSCMDRLDFPRDLHREIVVAALRAQQASGLAGLSGCQRLALTSLGSSLTLSLGRSLPRSSFSLLHS